MSNWNTNKTKIQGEEFEILKDLIEVTPSLDAFDALKKRYMSFIVDKEGWLSNSG